LSSWSLSHIEHFYDSVYICSKIGFYRRPPPLSTLGTGTGQHYTFLQWAPSGGVSWVTHNKSGRHERFCYTRDVVKLWQI